MPTWRKKPPNDHNFNKRSTANERAALADAAQLATARLYADVLAFWTLCARAKCRRHRRCAGEVMACLRRNMPSVAEHNHEAARSWVMVGGRNRVPPADHVEYAMRRTPATMWFGSRFDFHLSPQGNNRAPPVLIRLACTSRLRERPIR